MAAHVLTAMKARNRTPHTDNAYLEVLDNTALATNVDGVQKVRGQRQEKATASRVSCKEQVPMAQMVRAACCALRDRSQTTSAPPVLLVRH